MNELIFKNDKLLYLYAYFQLNCTLQGCFIIWKSNVSEVTCNDTCIISGNLKVDVNQLFSSLWNDIYRNLIGWCSVWPPKMTFPVSICWTLFPFAWIDKSKIKRLIYKKRDIHEDCMIEFVLCFCPLQTISTHIKTYTRHSWQIKQWGFFCQLIHCDEEYIWGPMTFIPVTCTLTTTWVYRGRHLNAQFAESSRRTQWKEEILQELDTCMLVSRIVYRYIKRISLI